MRRLFKDNFDNFEGEAWSLPSGASLDQILYSYAEGLTYESALHSFIIEDAEGVLQLATQDADRASLTTKLVDRVGERLPSLSAPEVTYLRKFDLPPDRLWEMLAASGWRTIGESLNERPDNEFQEVVHDCITHILRVYRQNDMRLPQAPSEVWYTHALWGFIAIALQSHRCLEYQPGEVCLQSSTLRRNKTRMCDTRQNVGHKADGLVIAVKRRAELCAIESSRKDGGPNTTKAFADTRKLAKMMKDMHDGFRNRATINIREELVTFGVRISGPSLTIFTMHQRPGRFYQLCEESTVEFPPLWTEEDSSSVVGVLSRAMALRKAMIDMAGQLPQWTTIPIEPDLNPIESKDWMAATLTSPQLIPTTPRTPLTAVPELSLLLLTYTRQGSTPNHARSHSAFSHERTFSSGGHKPIIQVSA
ncbi:hypothetical protein FBU30_009551 [Linnemannia zychae]|nr:hypothetical protein FBU30_009551 [Linnemannia zychae]